MHPFKKFFSLLALLVLMVVSLSTPTVNALDSDANEDRIEVKDFVISQYEFDKKGDPFVSVGIDQGYISLENPIWKPKTTEELEEHSSFFVDTENYTFYYYAVYYTDETVDIGYNTDIDFNVLKKNATNKNKVIYDVILYYGLGGKIEVTSILVRLDGSETVLSKDIVHNGRFFYSYYDDEDEVTINLPEDSVSFLNDSYILLENQENSASFTFENQTHVIKYRLPQLTVRYLDEKGEKLHDDTVIEKNESNSVTFSAIEIDGYKLTGSSSVSKEFENKDITYSFNYTKIDDEKPETTDPETSDPETTDPETTNPEEKGEELPGTGINKSPSMMFGISSILLGILLVKSKK